jgi:hypothetical protein
MVQSRETQTYIYTINNTGHTRSTLVQSSMPIQGRRSRGIGGKCFDAKLIFFSFCFIQLIFPI